ncbi:pimeloyl-ACP methyl ester carboxylesterase [Crossiella equi]|uniref:Pimeloyl-ACP methyl ester carboxylesterase n=1 Tax=Crossiella equi TaxID=130796 RepID=A0ABS5AQY3_9PSEU|nr:alpha/beta hydrolase [Crossiella equi]MBP2478966.1 pimeloyl-ACP methyl ester carboxylesterase [Crossiella equi]
MRLRQWTAAVAGVALVVTGTPAVAAEAAAVPAGLKPFYEQRLTWAPCPGNSTLECSAVLVPMNYAKPGQERIQVAVSRLKAKDPARRRGVLLVNPGGPGGSGLGLPATRFAGQPLAQVYDVIGFDPRGVGQSTQLRCETSQLDLPRPTRPTDAQLPNFTALARAAEDGCARAGGEYRRHVNTRNTARDMDVIRGALSEKKINFFGYSYGTWLGAVYGSLFARNLDRSVLDSAMDPNKTWHEQDLDTVDSIKFNYDSWAAWAAQRNATYRIGATPAEIRTGLDRVAEALKTKPVGGLSRVDDLDLFTGFYTRYRAMWGGFAQQLRVLLDELAGTPAPVEETKALLAIAQRSLIKPTSAGTFQAVLCEWDWPTDVQTNYRLMRDWRDRHPYGDTVSFLAPNNCAFRGFARPEPLPKISRTGYPTGLVVHAEGDTQTAYPNGVAMAETLNHHLVSVPNDGEHGQFGGGSACVDNTVNRYLVDGVLPATRSECEGVDKLLPAAVPDAAPLTEVAEAILRRAETGGVY